MGQCCTSKTQSKTQTDVSLEPLHYSTTEEVSKLTQQVLDVFMWSDLFAYHDELDLIYLPDYTYGSWRRAAIQYFDCSKKMNSHDFLCRMKFRHSLSHPFLVPLSCLVAKEYATEEEEGSPPQIDQRILGYGTPLHYWYLCDYKHLLSHELRAECLMQIYNALCYLHEKRLTYFQLVGCTLNSSNIQCFTEPTMSCCLNLLYPNAIDFDNFDQQVDLLAFEQLCHELDVVFLNPTVILKYACDKKNV